MEETLEDATILYQMGNTDGNVMLLSNLWNLAMIPSLFEFQWLYDYDSLH